MNILDIMSTGVIKVSTTTTVADAIDLMQDHKVRHLVVVNPDGALVGIVSDRDLRLAAQSPYAIFDAEKADIFAQSIVISQVMTESPECVSPHCGIAEVAHIMLEYNISAVPVTQDYNVVGIVTTTDLLKVLVAQPI